MAGRNHVHGWVEVHRAGRISWKCTSCPETTDESPYARRFGVNLWPTR